MIKSITIPVAALVLALQSACSGTYPAPPIADARLVSGPTIGQLAAVRDTVVVLVYSPAECVACYGVLSEWLKWSSDRDSSLFVVLKEEPTESQAEELLLFGIEYDQIADARRGRALSSPVTHVFIEGQHVATSMVRPGRDFILRTFHDDIPGSLENVSPASANDLVDNQLAGGNNERAAESRSEDSSRL